MKVGAVKTRSIRELLREKGFIRIMETHNGLTALIVERASAERDGASRTFDGMWVSSLCDSTAKGKPDIELVDFTSRCQTLDEILDVTTKPIILDGDTGGLTEHLVFNIRTMERLGVSAVIIEDKMGLKRNSLFGVEVEQRQDSIENFSAKLSACKKAQRTNDFMVFARIESLILKAGQADALARADAFIEAGADGIMIHSRDKSPEEIKAFCGAFRPRHPDTPLVVVPSSFNTITETELRALGVNIVIYANQLLRSAYPAMMKTAVSILAHERAHEAESLCMPISEILTLIPDSL